MKRFFTLFSFCTCMILVTGCGGEKLTCTKEEEPTKDMKIKQEIVMTFKKEEITNLKLKREVKVEGDFLKTIDTLEKSLKEEFTSFNDKAIKASSSKKDNTVKISATANYKKMKDSTKKSFGTAPYDKNIKDMKKYFEDQRFTCK